jgi:UPF0755 protein
MRRLLRGLRNLLLMVFLVGAGGVLYWRWAISPADPSAHTVHRIVVAPGETPGRVGRLLERDGLIRSARVFSLLAHGVPIRPGAYDVSAAEAPGRILKHLVRGDFATIRVVIPEGFMARQIAHRLARVGLINDEEAFLTLVTTQGSTFKASFALPTNLEGYLFPDTYRIPVGADDRTIAQEMVNTFDRLIARGVGPAIQKSRRPLADIVNVAAMVEHEAETDADRPRIAGVIYNRLAKHMKLEIDATVQYAQGVHKSRLLYRDLTIDSPYNTYKVYGLPPTPICSPGLPSLEAAIAPTPSDYLYYVGQAGGSHIFARTFAEHEHNIALVRKAARLRKARAAAGTPAP